MMSALFYLAVVFVAYTYAIYPAIVMLLAHWTSPPRFANAGFAPPVTVIIPAYNEARYIVRKIESVLASSYQGRITVVVMSDGSADGTAEAAASIGDPRVIVRAHQERRGKITILNEAVMLTADPILVLTDAGEMLHRDAITRLVRWFSDPEVGAVSGEITLIETTTGFSRNLGVYWWYEERIREAESRVGCLVGAAGPLYAVRRECFRPLPADTVLDDVAIPFEVVRQGYSVKFEPKAIAYERATTEAATEIVRKRRTLSGNYQLIMRYSDLLNPLKSPIAIQFWSHKVFRLLVPYALLVVFVGTWFLPEAIWGVVLASQLVFYGLAGVPFWFGHYRWFHEYLATKAFVSFPYTFCALNWAAVVGFYYYVADRYSVKWEKVK
jgi:biofilm PGA synthesis N-glycosyltransferase PgaC